MNHALTYGLWNPLSHAAAGVDINDIVTLGNRASSAELAQRYHREQLSHFDFANIVLRIHDDDDEFHDAESKFDQIYL